MGSPGLVFTMSCETVGDGGNGRLSGSRPSPPPSSRSTYVMVPLHEPVTGIHPVAHDGTKEFANLGFGEDTGWAKDHAVGGRLYSSGVTNPKPP